MSAIEKNYSLKILILSIATLAGIFAIWYALIREESADWISSQVVRQASPYAVTETEDGLIISNVVAGYEFSLPKGFKTLGARNLNFYLEAAGVKTCTIRHYYLNAAKADKLLAGEGKLIIPWHEQKLVFELINQTEINDCEKYLRGIKNKLADF